MLKRLFVLALTVVGCAGSPATLPPTIGPASASPMGTAVAVSSASPREQPPSPGCHGSGFGASLEPTVACTQFPEVRELPGPVTELEAWTYLKSDFSPNITFTIGEGWTATQEAAGFFDIQDKPGDVDVVAVQFGNVAEADTAQEAAANVAARPNLTVSGPEDVTIDGRRGLHLLVETTDPLDTDPPVFHPVIRLTPGDVSIASARRLELNLLDVDGQVLAIMVGGSIAEWDHALEISSPVIESVEIGD